MFDFLFWRLIEWETDNAVFIDGVSYLPTQVVAEELAAEIVYSLCDVCYSVAALIFLGTISVMSFSHLVDFFRSRKRAKSDLE